jgi:hypothetical protein
MAIVVACWEVERDETVAHCGGGGDAKSPASDPEGIGLDGGDRPEPNPIVPSPDPYPCRGDHSTCICSHSNPEVEVGTGETTEFLI